MHPKFSGTGVALITPFNENKNIDESSLEKLINHVIADGKGVDFVVSLGTTGEAATLTHEEKMRVFALTKDIVAQRVPIVLGFGGNNTAALVNSIKAFDFEGYDGILSASPYYNKPSQEGIFQHYKAINDVAPVPVISYNVPGRTSSNITAKTMIRIANELPNIVGVKEASGNLVQCMEILNGTNNFLLTSGDDVLTLSMLAFGMHGVISVIANAFPVEFSAMTRHALNGNFKEAAKIHLKLLSFNDPLYAEGNPVGIKNLLKHLGVCGDTLRLPLVKASSLLNDEMKNCLNQYQK